MAVHSLVPGTCLGVVVVHLVAPSTVEVVVALQVEAAQC